METFGDIIKSARNKAGLSQKQVYQNIKITDSRLSKMERNELICPPSEMGKLAVLYNIPIVHLYIAAGYLTSDDLDEYKMVFHGVEQLDDIETAHIQQCIDLLIRRKDQI